MRIITKRESCCLLLLFIYFRHIQDFLTAACSLVRPFFLHNVLSRSNQTRPAPTQCKLHQHKIWITPIYTFWARSDLSECPEEGVFFPGLRAVLQSPFDGSVASGDSSVSWQCRIRHVFRREKKKARKKKDTTVPSAEQETVLKIDINTNPAKNSNREKPTLTSGFEAQQKHVLPHQRWVCCHAWHTSYSSTSWPWL